MSARSTVALVFDFDGVLVESTDVKTRAFAAIYRAFGGEVTAHAVEYHRAHAGISRHVKFRHLHQALLGITLSDEDVVELDRRFSALVVEAVIAAPWVAGAREFLEAHHRSLALFVASGTPEGELRMIVARRAMEGYFRSVHGSPATKREIVGGLLARHGYVPRQMLVVGDALADLDGAAGNGVPFVGRVPAGSASPFPAGTPVIADLRALAECVAT